MGNTLVAILHHDAESDYVNFEGSNIEPSANYYGGKFRQAIDAFLKTDGRFLFIICSDVKIIDPNWIDKRQYLDQKYLDMNLGLFGFKLASNSPKKSFWKWSEMTGEVPFIDGYCIGIKREVLEAMPNDLTEKGYGIDIALAYTCHKLGLKAKMFDEIQLRHAIGQSYSETEAMAELHGFLSKNPDINEFYQKILYENCN